MALFLLFHALLQGFHELFPAAHGLDLGLLLLGQVQLRHLAQPFLRDVLAEQIGEVFQPLEDMAEDLIEPVQMPLVFHQRRAGKIVKVRDRIIREPGLHGLK